MLNSSDDEQEGHNKSPPKTKHEQEQHSFSLLSGLTRLVTTYLQIPWYGQVNIPLFCVSFIFSLLSE